jgi:O-antigen biosynthesis protein
MNFTGERVIEGDTPERIYRDHIVRYQFAVNFIKGLSILDVACGTGYGTKYLQDNGARETTGVDISNEAIRFAIRNYTAKNLTFYVGDALELQFPDSKFESVVSFETIEHVSDVNKYLSEMARVLHKSGLFIVSSPNRLITSPDYPRYQSRPDNEYHITEFSLEELINVLRKSFTIVGSYGQHMVNKMLMPRYIRKIIHRLLPQALGSKLYIDTGNQAVRLIPNGYHPRYIVLVCKRK